MAPPVTRKEYDLTAFKCAGEQVIRGSAEWSFDFNPTLLGKTLDVIEPTAADDSNSMSRHAGRYTGRRGAPARIFSDRLWATARGGGRQVGADVWDPKAKSAQDQEGR